jgi:hypothetical protein
MSGGVRGGGEREKFIDNQEVTEEHEGVDEGDERAGVLGGAAPATPTPRMIKTYTLDIDGEGESLSTQILPKYVNAGVKGLPLYYARCGIPANLHAAPLSKCIAKGIILSSKRYQHTHIPSMLELKVLFAFARTRFARFFISAACKYASPFLA